MIHLSWAPSLALGGVLAAGSTGLSMGDIAALMGGLAAIISAITGLIVALKRPSGVVVVSQEQLEEMSEDAQAIQPRKKRKP